jgi:hypothetical protein
LARADLNKALANGTVPKYDPAPKALPGEPNRYKVDVSTNRPGGFGQRIVKQRDPVTGAILRDASGQPLTTIEPAPLTDARVIFEYVPSKGTWEPVTYYPN